MKKLFAVVLAAALVMSLGVTAFAAGSETPEEASAYYTTPYVVRTSGTMDLYKVDDSSYYSVPSGEVMELTPADVDKLSAEVQESFLAAYEQVKGIEGKLVKYFCWIDVPADYLTKDFAYARYDFSCEGENVQVFVNGNEMEVVHVAGIDYYAKLTEFGALWILVDID